MAFTIRATKTVSEGSTSITNSNTYTVQASYKIQETVVDTTVDQEHLFALDISTMKAFAMQSTVDMTVHTNDAGTGSPQETFVLTAGVPVIWEEGEVAIFAGDVTALFVNNSSGSDGQLNVIAGLDV